MKTNVPYFKSIIDKLDASFLDRKFKRLSPSEKLNHLIHKGDIVHMNKIIPKLKPSNAVEFVDFRTPIHILINNKDAHTLKNVLEHIILPYLQNKKNKTSYTSFIHENLLDFDAIINNIFEEDIRDYMSFNNLDILPKQNMKESHKKSLDKLNESIEKNHQVFEVLSNFLLDNKIIFYPQMVIDSLHNTEHEELIFKYLDFLLKVENCNEIVSSYISNHGNPLSKQILHFINLNNSIPDKEEKKKSNKI